MTVEGGPTTSHWGAYRARPDAAAEGGIAVLPHPADPAPSPLLGNVAGALRHRTRVRRPAVPNAITAGLPSSRLSRGCTGQHALVQVERYAADPPPVTVTEPPTLLRKEEL